MPDPIGSQVIDYVYAQMPGTTLTQSLNHQEAMEWIGASLLGAWCSAAVPDGAAPQLKGTHMEYVKEYSDWLPVIGFVIGFIIGWRREPRR